MKSLSFFMEKEKNEQMYRPKASDYRRPWTPLGDAKGDEGGIGVWAG